MGKITLHIANAGGAFSDNDLHSITTAAHNAEAYLTETCSFDFNVDIVVTAPSLLMRTVPEDGITGRTYNSRLIVIVLDKSQAEINKSSVFETICHEMSHAIRWEKLPEYANTLFEGMIMEGLAVALEEKVLADNGIAEKQFFLRTVLDTTPTMIEDMIEKLKSSFDDTEYDYEKIFFAGSDTLPRWAGYRLGYHYVQKYLEMNTVSIAEATTVSYKNFSY